jgi:hypothetical protein
MIRIVQIAVPLYIAYSLLPYLANFYHVMHVVSNVLN